MSIHTPGQMLLFEEAPTQPSPPMRVGLGDGGAAVGSVQPVNSLQVCVLGSGSSGNSTVIRHGDGVMLIDAGFGPRATAKRLVGCGLDPDRVEAICLTHLDRDHFNPNWLGTLLRRRIRVYVHSRHVHSLYRLGDIARQLAREGMLRVFNNEGFEPLVGLRASPITLPHDRQGTTGFLLETEIGRIGYATDLGRVPDALIDHFRGVDLLAIECNYDPQMQIDSPRPGMLKRRIMNGYGHLSNQQSYEAVQQVIGGCPRGGPAHVVLLHLSRQCNCPHLVRRLFNQDRRLATRVVLAQQLEATPWLVLGGRSGGESGGGGEPHQGRGVVEQAAGGRVSPVPGAASGVEDLATLI